MNERMKKIEDEMLKISSNSDQLFAAFSSKKNILKKIAENGINGQDDETLCRSVIYYLLGEIEIRRAEISIINLKNELKDG